MMNFIQSHGVTIAISSIPFILGILLKLCPKQKLMNFVTPICSKAGIALSHIMLVRFGKKAADSIEEGVFVTLASTIFAAVDAFMKGLLSDNSNQTGE